MSNPSAVLSAKLLAAALTALVLVSVACSDSSTGPSSPATVADAGPSMSLDSGGPDAASITPRPDLCAGLTRGGEVIDELELAGAPVPPAGGALMPGTYDLVELDAYDGDASLDAGQDDAGETPTSRFTGRAAQITLVVAEFSLSTIEARGTSQPDGLGPEQAHAVLYRTDGASLVETAVCPSTALPASRSYSILDGGLVLYPDATHRELYRRRP